MTNGRTAINIPGDLPSPKSKSPPAVIEKRNSIRHEQHQQQQQQQQQQQPKDHREHHHRANGAKVSNHNNNNKVNSACLNNLILPLLSDVSVNFHNHRVTRFKHPIMTLI